MRYDSLGYEPRTRVAASEENPQAYELGDFLLLLRSRVVLAIHVRVIGESCE